MPAELHRTGTGSLRHAIPRRAHAPPTARHAADGAPSFPSAGRHTPWRALTTGLAPALAALLADVATTSNDERQLVLEKKVAESEAGEKAEADRKAAQKAKVQQKKIAAAQKKAAEAAAELASLQGRSTP